MPFVDWIAFWIRLQVCDSVGTVFEKRCSPKLPLSSHSALDPIFVNHLLTEGREGLGGWRM